MHSVSLTQNHSRNHGDGRPEQGIAAPQPSPSASASLPEISLSLSHCW